MPRHARLFAFALVAALTTGAVVGAPGVSDYELTRQTIGGGGGTSAGGDFEMTGAVGEPASGGMSGGNFALGGGFHGAAGEPCPTDVNGDGQVNVDDLVIVILDWACAGPACEGDANGDDQTDVDDLVAVILRWGPCE